MEHVALPSQHVAKQSLHYLYGKSMYVFHTHFVAHLFITHTFMYNLRACTTFCI